MKTVKQNTDFASANLKAFTKAVNEYYNRKSRFERFYDFMTNLISDGKSFAPNELR